MPWSHASLAMAWRSLDSPTTRPWPAMSVEGIVFGYASPSDTLLAESLTWMHATILDIVGAER